MTNYRRSIAAVAFSFLVLAAAAPASADSIGPNDLVGMTLSRGPAPTFLLPGFDVSRAPATAGNTGYTGGPFGLTNNTTQDAWVTFCIERDQPIDQGPQYVVKSVGTTATDGRTLSPAAAWLYEAFRTNGLNGLAPFGGTFDYKDPADTRLLQFALWLAQKYDITDQASSAEQDAAAALIAAAGKDSGIVRIVQLVGIDGSPAQDVLALQPVPEPASMLLLGGGLLGLAAARRRRAARQ